MPEQLPVWQAVGTEPTIELQTNGWQPGMKPSAQNMNWLFNRAYKCIEDLQNNKADAQALTTLSQTVSTLEQNFTEHLAENIYGVATGTNALVMTDEKVTTYKAGMLVAFKNTTANTGAVTLNINDLGAKSIKKSNGNDLSSGNLKANGVYQVRYDGVNFFLLGEGGEYGTATTSDVKVGITFGTENGLATGTFTSDSNAVANEILNGKTAYVNGSKITGTIPSKTAQTFTPGTTNQTIAANQFLIGIQTILGDPDLIASNILSGKTIFGVAGSLQPGLKHASGSTYVSNNTITITGLAFTPKYFLGYVQIGTNLSSSATVAWDGVRLAGNNDGSESFGSVNVSYGSITLSGIVGVLNEATNWPLKWVVFGD